MLHHLDNQLERRVSEEGGNTVLRITFNDPLPDALVRALNAEASIVTKLSGRALSAIIPISAFQATAQEVLFAFHAFGDRARTLADLLSSKPLPPRFGLGIVYATAGCVQALSSQKPARAHQRLHAGAIVLLESGVVRLLGAGFPHIDRLLVPPPRSHLTLGQDPGQGERSVVSPAANVYTLCALACQIFNEPPCPVPDPRKMLPQDTELAGWLTRAIDSADRIPAGSFAKAFLRVDPSLAQPENLRQRLIDATQLMGPQDGFPGSMLLVSPNGAEATANRPKPRGASGWAGILTQDAGEAAPRQGSTPGRSAVPEPAHELKLPVPEDVPAAPAIKRLDSGFARLAEDEELAAPPRDKSGSMRLYLNDPEAPSVWPWVGAAAGLFVVAGLAFYFAYLHDPQTSEPERPPHMIVPNEQAKTVPTPTPTPTPTPAPTTTEEPAAARVEENTETAPEKTLHLVTVISTPSGAVVEIDGKPIGKTPVVKQHDFGNTARARISVKHPSYEPWQERVRVRGDQLNVTVNAKLQKR